MPSPFESCSHDQVRLLIDSHPLTWVIPVGGDAAAAARLPLLGDYAPDGSLVRLVGHLSRRNPLLAALGPDRRAVALFAGPEGYVSPAQAGLADWGPTWNYAQVAVDCVLEVSDALTAPVLDRLVAAMEPDWRAEALGPRAAGMRAQIIGFHAAVTAVRPRFKLGQDERPEVFASILARHPNAELVAWMRRLRQEAEIPIPPT